MNGADKKHLGGPKGGRLLEMTEPNAEFFLDEDHTATITFYDAAKKPVPATAQSVMKCAERAEVQFDSRSAVEY